MIKRLIFLCCALAFCSMTVLAQQRQKIDRDKQATTANKTNGKKTKPSSSQSAQKSANKQAVFSISSTSASFEASGGTKTFTVNSSNSWRISVNTNSWGHLQRNGNTLTLSVDKQEQAVPRSDYFTIASGDQSIRVNISQSAAPPKFEISSTYANFGESGGTKAFTVTSTNSWQIGTKTASWGHLTVNGNILTLKVDANSQTKSRTDYFTIKAGDQQIRVNIKQDAAASYLAVNGATDKVSLEFGKYGLSQDITVNTNVGDYVIWGKPYWCYVSNKTSGSFTLSCSTNNSSYYRNNYLEVWADDKKVRINIRQDPDFRKYRRRRNGGWVNMAIGYEGSYGVNGENSWFANGILGLRLGNYRDAVQLELGAAPGVISVNKAEPTFHLPLYGSLKFSATSGKFYLKMGGAYNVIRDYQYEGQYSLRAGFGSAWKHFEWDWAFVQLNAPADYYRDVKFNDLFDTSNMFAGMRMSWYITR